MVVEFTGVLTKGGRFRLSCEVRVEEDENEEGRIWKDAFGKEPCIYLYSREKKRDHIESACVGTERNGREVCVLLVVAVDASQPAAVGL